jgi:hypothetical protein
MSSSNFEADTINEQASLFGAVGAENGGFPEMPSPPASSTLIPENY